MNKILTPREKEILDLVIKDFTTKEISKRLQISEKTVRNHISNVMQKTGTKGRTGTVMELIRLKELSIERG